MFTRFEGDKISQDWEVYDEFGVMTQMGVIPVSD
jgi:predicted ester cyclase